MTDRLVPRPRRSVRIAGLTLIVLGLCGIFLASRNGSLPSFEVKGHKSAATPRPGRPPLSAVANTETQRPPWKDVYAQLPLSFEANQGQTSSNVKFLSRGEGYGLFLTRDEAVLALGRERPTGDRLQADGRHTEAGSAAVVRMKLVRANRTAKVYGIAELPGKSNYFIGNNPAKWRVNVPTYGKVKYEDVYPGVDLVYYGNQGQLEYDLVVAPGADSRAIDLRVGGAGRASLNAGGDLVLAAGRAQVVFHRPVIYQEGGASGRRQIQGGYVLEPSGAGIQDVHFQVGAYDHTQALVIDPSLSYSTYLGGSDSDIANGIAIDGSGNAYVAGQTFSVDFPVQAPEQATCPTCSSSTNKSDVFISKVNAAGSALVYSTYIGGSFLDFATAIAVDSAGNAYVTGETTSTDFPIQGAFQTTGDTFGDAFVTELNSLGSALVYSTYLGGAGVDMGQGITLDGSGNAYVTGTTSSLNFPVQGAFQSTNKGGSDAFVTKIAPLGTKILYSTYLGGSGNDNGNGITIDSSGNAYVTGQTSSNNFPTESAYQAAYGGQGDAFVAKLSFSGANITLDFSTYLGGTNADQGYGVAVDSSNNVYVTGATSSIDFPTQNPFQANLAGGTSVDVFVSKLSNSGSSLVYSTYLGGSGSDTGRGVGVDSAGIAHVVGYTTSSNFPTANPIQNNYNGNTDAFLARLNPMGCGLAFSTFLGGKSMDEALGVRATRAGDTYLAGFTASNDFQVQNPLQASTHGNNDAFVAKVPAFSAPSVCVSAASLIFPAATAGTTSAAMTVTVTNAGNAALTITSIAATGSFTESNTCGTSLAAGQNCAVSVTFSPTTAGAASGTLSIIDNAAGAPSATQNIVLSGTGADFGLSVSPPTLAVSAGQPASYTLSLSPSLQFTTAVTLTCNTTVLAATCTVTPASITPTGGSTATAKVTVTTTAHSLVLPPGFGSHSEPPLAWLVALLSLGLVGAAAWARRNGPRRAWVQFVTLAGVALLVAAWFGCGINTSAPSFTPPGSYSVTLTGTAGSLSHSVRATLTVQ